MKQIIKSAAYILFIAAVTFASCKKIDQVSSPTPPPPTTKQLVANAGIDQLITLPTDSVTLDGSASTGAISSYQWTQISGPTSSSIHNASGVKTVVKALARGFYKFELTVTDNVGLSSKDTVQIIVDVPVAIGTLGESSHICTPVTANSTYTQGIALTAANTLQVQVNVTAAGTYNISTNIVNGVNFSGSGTFAATGVQNVILNGSGTPVNSGVQNFIVIFGSSTCNFSIPFLATPTPASWTQIKGLSTNDYETFIISIGSKIYRGGGDSTFFEYDPGTNVWASKKSSPPLVRADLISFSMNDKGYVGLGADYNGASPVYYQEMWEYNPVNDNWTKKNNVPAQVSGAAVVFVTNNKVYIVGGNNNHVVEYDPATDTYTQKNNFPGTAFNYMAAFTVNGKNYCAGGAGNIGSWIPSNECWEYMAVNDTWQQRASLPFKLGGQRGFSLANSGYVTYNGESQSGGAQNYRLLQYDPSLDKWTELVERYPGRASYSLNATSLNGVAYLGFGWDINGDPASDFWRLTQ